MKAITCGFPIHTRLPSYLEPVTFWDAYTVDLVRPDQTMEQVYLGIFGYLPAVFKFLLRLRNRIVSVFGLSGPTAAELHQIEIKSNYRVGEKIALFTLLESAQDEIIAGGDAKHLDFRVSVLRHRQGGRTHVIVTTVVKTHNLFGRCYLFLIKPFHRYGVKRLMSDASAAGRI
ncbi:DUF2867 domain-containing protein [Caulobacter sp. DWR1-3-2b1]|uniref:DUF2867 domain-containing protein n=1 Tax=Caulobacter sp. DWR1-3-2b1 TaxID=2804670 RepID=UPI003CF3ADAC